MIDGFSQKNIYISQLIRRILTEKVITHKKFDNTITKFT